jgi:DNA-binding response OmpR family regulator
MTARPWRVLIVEDEWILADLIARALAEAGYAVIGPAADVSEGLRRLDEKPVDAAILDVHLGDEDSFAIAQELLQRGIGFAFLTGYSSREIPATFAGAPLIRKPARIDEIRATIDSLLQGPPQRDPSTGN